MTIFGVEIGAKEVVFACRSDMEFNALYDEAAAADISGDHPTWMWDVWYNGIYQYTNNIDGGGFSVWCDGKHLNWGHCDIPWYEEYGYYIVEVSDVMDDPVDCVQFDLDFDMLYS